MAKDNGDPKGTCLWDPLHPPPPPFERDMPLHPDLEGHVLSLPLGARCVGGYIAHRRETHKPYP